MEMAFITGVVRGSAAEEAGIGAGDQLITINGHDVQDLIDYQYLEAQEVLELHIAKPDGTQYLIEVEKDEDEELGLVFAEPVFDGQRVCRNRCLFCFVDQLPKGLRPSLYVKDDDYRLSFLQGTFISLTNMGADDWQRIFDLRLGPLYVSVHAVDPQVRETLVGNPKARLVGQQLQWLAAAGLQVHAQVVLCPGFNDGDILSETIGYLCACWPHIRSIAIVPVGLTRYRRNLQPVSPELARGVITLVEGWQGRMLAKHGTRLVWAADELYFKAGLPMPSVETYEDCPQLENGVGMTALFLDELNAIQPAELTHVAGRRVSLATGRLALPVIDKLACALAEAGVEGMVYGVPNRFFGGGVNVAGLLTGEDLLHCLTGQELGEALFIPAVSLKRDSDVFLDDMPLSELEKRLSVPIEPATGPLSLFHRLGESNLWRDKGIGKD
jgi:putative radical SAM enzyme (TIGR03279 family)